MCSVEGCSTRAPRHGGDAELNSLVAKARALAVPPERPYIHYAPTTMLRHNGRLTVPPSACGLKCSDVPGSVGPLLTSALSLIDCPECIARVQS